MNISKMNVIYDGRVIVHFRIEEISCYYFCDHFHKIFTTRENDDTPVSFLKTSKKMKYLFIVIATEILLEVFFNYLRPLSKRSFEKAKKILI